MLPLLLVGLVLYAVTRPRTGATSIGARPRLAAPGSTASRAGQIVTFLFGVPYAIEATTGPLTAKDTRRLAEALRLGTYHASRIAITAGNPRSTVRFCFVAPKTEAVPLGQPLSVDLGDARARLVLRRVTRLDGKGGC